MQTTIHEVAPDIFRLSTHIDEVAPPAGFSFNQFLIRGDEPFLFHTGMRQLFPLVSDAVSRLIAIDDLRWISFAHVEADELGAMNNFLAAAPPAQVVHGGLAVDISLNDLADRAPRAMGDDEVLEVQRRTDVDTSRHFEAHDPRHDARPLIPRRRCSPAHGAGLRLRHTWGRHRRLTPVPQRSQPPTALRRHHLR